MAPLTKDAPSRAGTTLSSFSDDAVPEVDPSSTAGLLAERLQAWKHTVGFLEEYVSTFEKIHKAQSKEYEKALKVISHPLREGHHFDQSLGGIAGYFENLRSNTQALINTNLETEKAIKGSVLPILERLHKEVKHKAKELAHGAEKDEKEVTRTRNLTQKHIELLGQQTASFESAGGRIIGHEDPYVVRRGVLHRLHKQVIEENNHHNNLVSVQANLQVFEGHVIEVLQQAMEAFSLVAGGQGEKTRALHTDMLGAVQRVTPDFEWSHFSERCKDRLVDANTPARSVEAISFPNMDHTATRPLIEGSLERKSRNKLSWGYSTGYYVVTPSRYLHEFKDSDDVRADPKPELSIYLPDALIGQPSGDRFTLKGKDTSKTFSGKLTGSSELSFKAHTSSDAQRWYETIKSVVGSTSATLGSPGPSSPASPTSPISPLSPKATTSSIPEKLDDKLPIREAQPVAAAPAPHIDQESGVTGSPVAAPKAEVPAQPVEKP